MRAQHILVLAALAAAGSLDVCAQTADDFFDDRVLHEIRLRINPADWLKLKQNYLDNTYYACNMEWRGGKVENIGIRSRGNGSRSEIKPALRVDFNRFEEGQEFLGLKSFVLDNEQEPALLRERLAMAVMRRIGAPCSRRAQARVYVNNEYAGLYGVVESVDKTFLKRVFGQDDGYLYKYENPPFPWSFDYLGPDLARYSPKPFEAKTHEKDPAPAPLEAMLRAVNQSSDEEFIRAASEYLDLKWFLVQVAAEVFLSDVDGLLAPNNFYLYRFEKSRLARFLPWDMDLAFGWHEQSIWLQTDTHALMRRLLRVPEYRAFYLAALEMSAAAAGQSGGWLEKETRRAYEQVRNAVREDAKKRCADAHGVLGPCSNDQFEEAVSEILKFVERRSDSVRAQVDAAGLRTGESGPRINADLSLVSGSTATISGERLAEAPVEAAAGAELPLSLGGVSVWINGYPARLSMVSPTSLLLVVPEELDQSNPAPVTVFANGIPANTVLALVTK